MRRHNFVAIILTIVAILNPLTKAEHKSIKIKKKIRPIKEPIPIRIPAQRFDEELASYIGDSCVSKYTQFQQETYKLCVLKIRFD